MEGQIESDSTQALDTTGGNKKLMVTDSCTSATDLDPAEEYNMKHKRRGVALIFNHERFHWGFMPERRGTNADKENLIRRLRELGFEVLWFDDLKAEDMLQKIDEASVADHSDADCFLCVFLSHGEDDHIYAFNTKIEIQRITNMFKGDKCLSLVGKPKIFIIQACRGDEYDGAVAPRSLISSELEEPTTNEVEVDAAAVHTLPAGADFIMCYSVAKGYFSFRDIETGSWYIQDLCELLQRYGSSLEFTEILTLVNRKMARRTVDKCKIQNALGKKQVPCFNSMLTKKLYLRPKMK